MKAASFIRKLVYLTNRDGIYKTGIRGMWYLKILFLNYIMLFFLKAGNLSIIDRNELRRQIPNGNIWKFGSNEDLEMNKIFSLNDTHPPKIRNQLKSYHLEQPFVCNVGSVIIDPETGAPIAEDNTLILDTISSRLDRVEVYFMQNLSRIRSLDRNRIAKDNDPTELDTAVLLYTPFGGFAKASDESGGPSGWIKGQLTKLQGVEKYIEETGNKPTLILPPNPSSYLIESLEALAYSSDDWITWSGESMYVENLIVPSYRSLEYKRHYYQYIYDSRIDSYIDYKYTSPEAIRWVRDEIKCRQNISDETTNRRIVIDRSDASWRQIANYEELKPTLKEYGIQSHVLSKLSFLEQFKLFNGAELILGVTGAGLANMAFSENCKVIVCYGDDRKPTYLLQARSLGFGCGYLVCDPVGGDPEYPLRRNLHVDASELLELFNIMNITEASGHDQIEEPQNNPQ